ncbi:hypothetical protein LCGC14_0564520 [marine sediment metagenome]|uniref:DUF4435 domain-containing protein n=1 Tax=marine sediment metagenome TaxID=412755 RepID=A0A0F9U7F6_9ZZZZ
MSSQRQDRGMSGLAEIKNILNNNIIKNHSTRTMIVEGSTDIKLFSKLISKYRNQVRIINPFRTHNLKQNNKGEVIKIIKICNQEDWVKNHQGNRGIFGIVDADFMNLNRGINIKNLLLTKFHDIDIEIFTSSYILEKYLNDAYPKKNFSKSQLLKIRRICLKLASMFGKYLLLLEMNHIYSNTRNQKNFKIKNFLERDNINELVLKTDLIEENILNNNWDVNLNDLNEINNINLKQLANSHDYFVIFWRLTFEKEEFPLTSKFCARDEKYCEKMLKLSYICKCIIDQEFLAKIFAYF